MDYADIENLFNNPPKLDKYAHKQFVQVHPVNTNYDQPIRYNCIDHQDKLIDYHNGFILLNVTVKNHAGADGVSNLANDADVAPKGSHSFIEKSIITINNQDIENNTDVFLITEMLNQLEYSHDYARIAKQFLYSQDTASGVASSGHVDRKSLIPAGANHAFTFNVKIPLAYFSSFFRSLDFPLINQHIEFEITYRLKMAILGAAVANVGNDNALDVTINKSSLYLQLVQLPSSENEKLVNGIKSKSLKRKVIWDKYLIRDSTALAANTDESIDIEAGIDGVRKLFILPKTNFNFNQLTVDLHNTITLTDMNIVVDSQDFYPQDIKNDVEAYSLISENFNNGGKDFNTGALLDYKIFKTQNKFYVFDISRQRVFEGNPRKSQSIRFRCKPSAACHLKLILAQKKESHIDFGNPLGTKTV